MKTLRWKTLLAYVGLAGAFVYLYGAVLGKLAHDWANDGNYSHGFLIPPIAAYLAWERRARLQALRLRPTVVGFVVVVLSLMVLVAGTLGAELFLTRVSLIGVIAGVILALAGWQHLRTLAFPVAFLLLMIPIPAIIFNQIAFPLQLTASRLGAGVLSTAGIPVLREGNVIVLATTTLEVAEACSGIRSLISLLMLAIVLGYFSDGRAWARTTIALASVPIAIVANGLRVAGTGIAAHFLGPSAAEGFFHNFSGWLLFSVALVLLFLVQRVIAGVGSGPSTSLVLTPARAA
jgi:exosortase